LQHCEKDKWDIVLLSVESEKCELIKGATFAWLVQLNLVAASVHSVFLGT
jgi:hypothetical protein